LDTIIFFATIILINPLPLPFLMIPFIKKYMPKNKEDIVGQSSALLQIDDFITNFKKQKKKSLFLWGPSGTGKTSSVHALADKHELEIIEINASDVRNKAQIQEKLGAVLAQQSLFFKGKIVLVDEIDGLSGTKDRGGLLAVSKLIDTSPYPIILTAFNPYDYKLNTIKKKASLIEFKPLDYLSIFEILKHIADSEKIKYNEDDLKSLARRSGGDARACINDFQTLSKGKELTKESLDTLHDRMRIESMIQALLKVFKTTDPLIALQAYDNVMENHDQIFLWLDENIPKEYTKPQDLVRAYDALSRADVYKGRIRRWQHWRFLAYINPLLSAGIALAKDEKYKTFTQYAPTTKLLKIWMANMKLAKKKSIAQKIASHSHTSTKRILDSFPFFKEAFKKNKTFANNMADLWSLDKDEVTWMRK